MDAPPLPQPRTRRPSSRGVQKKELNPEKVAEGICQSLEDLTSSEWIVENGSRRMRTMSWRKSERQIEAVVPKSKRILGKVKIMHDTLLG
jgi:hypothetical protein